MEAPDLIYLSPVIYNSMTNRDYYEGTLEYIRKDTILRWAQERLLALSTTEEDCAAYELEKAIYKSLIDKIDSL